ncbi:MAG: FAD/NAD(P)-binding protein [Elusimicrobia bacterium]|nr:FAD/NAD(P)-binding protein [Elusimicrobiota bacterium]
MQNIYLPELAKIEKITEETPDIKTFDISFADAGAREKFTYLPGQFIMMSVFGFGEAPFGLASTPDRKGYFQCSIKKMGKVTSEIHRLDAGNIVGIRGPYGNGFPVKEIEGQRLLFIAGGIGLAPLRSLIYYCFERRKKFPDITILYGARTVKDLVYKPELKKWQEDKSIKTVLTVDPGGEDKNWTGKIGLVPKILAEMNPFAENTAVVLCGPPIMIKFTFIELLRMGFREKQVITTLERTMQCGVGKCGHCSIDKYYVCKDGPVFNYEQIKTFLEEI